MRVRWPWPSKASAAIPGVYAPVRFEQRLFVDGGNVENVPVQPLREMGAEVIVAATLGETLDFQPVRTLLRVLTHAFLIAVNTATRLDLSSGGVDVIIKPEPPNASSSWRGSTGPAR